MRILAVPNDDGFGPSALLSYVVKAILRAEPRAHVTIWNDFAFGFNRSLYEGEIEAGRVSVERVFNLIQLVREDGVVSLSKSLGRMGGYADASAEYGRGERFDLVLDFGAPAAAAWARRRGIPSVTVFDHSWSRSLEMIGGEAPPADWRRLVDEVSRDEERAEQVILFPEWIAPVPFRTHWEGLIGAERVAVFDGALREPSAWSFREAGQFLGIRRPGEVALVQGGGTSVWNPPLRRLVEQLLDPASRVRLSREELTLVVWFPDRLLRPAEVRAFGRLQRVRRLKMPTRGTIQKVLEPVDYLILRAGGGSVNDAIACRKPFVCIREPGQLQIEAILEECHRRGLTWPVEIDAFAADPLGVILEQRRRLKASRNELNGRFKAIPNNAAAAVAQRVLARVR